VLAVLLSYLSPLDAFFHQAPFMYGKQYKAVLGRKVEMKAHGDEAVRSSRVI